MVNEPCRRCGLGPFALATPRCGARRKAVLVFDASTGKRVNDVVIASVTPACGDIIFRPVTAAGKYYVYYLPQAGL